MKFILTIYVCSFLDFTCSPGVQYPVVLDNWHKCVIKAFDESKDLIIKIPPDVVEKHRLATKYTCEPVMGT
jgi:trans-aconitate methyltransferase